MSGLPTVSLSAALADVDLFEPLFRGRSWHRWKVFCKILFGERMTPSELSVYRHHTERVDPPSGAFREAAIVCGRRGGKSRILALLAVYLAVFCDYSAYLAPGEQPVVAIIAANRRQAAVLLRYVAGLFRAVPLIASLLVDELAESARLANGVVIEIHTASIASPRGRTFIAILADEIAFWPATAEAANPDAEVIASVRPGLASIPNSLLLMASSPYWQKGVLFNTFRRHWGQSGARVLVWRGTTEEMNPTIDPAIIREAYEEDPASAASEYGAQWRTDIDNFVSREVVEAAVVTGLHELPPVDGIAYVGFVDAASGSGADRMVLAIAHADADGVAILDCVRGFAPPFGPAAVVEEMAAGVLRDYRVRRVVGDRWALGWVGERFEAAGIGYEVSDRVKSELYRELLGPLNSGRVRLLDDPQMIGELLNLSGGLRAAAMTASIIRGDCTTTGSMRRRAHWFWLLVSRVFRAGAFFISTNSRLRRWPQVPWQRPAHADEPEPVAALAGPALYAAHGLARRPSGVSLIRESSCRKPPSFNPYRGNPVSTPQPNTRLVHRRSVVVIGSLQFSRKAIMPTSAAFLLGAR